MFPRVEGERLRSSECKILVCGLSTQLGVSGGHAAFYRVTRSRYWIPLIPALRRWGQASSENFCEVYKVSSRTERYIERPCV